jgi:hypothetical protein
VGEVTPLVLYAVAFAGLSTLGGFLLAATRVLFAARLGVALATPWLALAVWQAARPPIGWPESATPPRGAAFVDGFVRTPAAGDRGEIDLWLQPPGAIRPRAYKLPYSPELHRRVTAALGTVRATHGGVRLQVQSPHGGGGGPKGAHALRFVKQTLPTKRRR